MDSRTKASLTVKKERGREGGAEIERGREGEGGRE